MPMRLFPWRALVAVGSLVAVAMLAAPARPQGQASTYSRDEWAAPGGDWAHTRFSTLASINTTNVGRLGGAWMVELPDRQVSKAPLMVKDGRMFVPTSQGTIVALDPATGRTLWTYRPSTPFSGNRGVGIGEGLLFGGLRNSNVVAVSQETGQVVWTYEHGPEIPSQGMSTAPAYGNGVVVAVVSLGDNFLRGRAIGLDARTGKFLWKFEVVPGPGEPGHETWPQGSDIWKYGGGALWTTPSVDAELGLVYLETGNAVPQWGGEHRPGDNLFNNSVVALDLKTGRMRWHFQTVHHDIWEHDLSTPLVLYDTEIGGRMRRVLMAMRTDGIAFFLDRETGRPILPVDERPVKQDAFLKTSPTQPFTRGIDRVGPECVNPQMIPPGFAAGCYFDPIRADMPNVLMPHMNMRHTPMAYSAQTGYLYATACVSPAWVRRDETGWAFIVPTRPPGMQQHGLMTALDATTGRIAWEKRLAYAACQGGSGATATAGGLVLHVEPDGAFQVWNARTGDIVWQFQTGETGLPSGSGPGGGPVAVYEAHGEQFLAMTMNRVVWAFKLGGSVPPREAPPAPPTVLAWTGAIESSAAVRLGATTTYTIASANKTVPWANDHALAPARIRVRAGSVVTWTNASKLAHTIAARDRSWSTKPIPPGGSGSATLAVAGTYEYVCTDHPWSIGQLIVE
jgi:quinohemoprotein ethanol dehydrogenase